MFKQLFEFLQKEDLIQQALADACEMLELTRILFIKAAEPLYEGESVNAQEIYDMDQKINLYEIEIRRKVMEHLSLSPRQDTTAALVLTTITVDIERIGDYSKNAYELWEIYGKQVNNEPVFQRLKQIFFNLKTMFDNTIKALSESDAEIAHRVMQTHITNSKDCEEIITALIRTPSCSDGMKSNQEVLAALASRYLKRTSAHLKNIASSIVNPFDRIGFKPGGTEEYE